METGPDDGLGEVDAEQLDFYINKRVAERQDLLTKVRNNMKLIFLSLIFI